jgi:glutamate racemase
VRIYLSELLAHGAQQNFKPDTLVLGCTHYPLLRRSIELALPAGIQVIDSAEATADKVARSLQKRALLTGAAAGRRRFFATDSVAKFQNLGASFLGAPIDKVELVDLGG